MENKHLTDLVKHSLSLSRETEWTEFKHNNDVPHEIGEYVSAIANACALHGKPKGYIIWGIDDSTHAIVGTTFQPNTKKLGNEEFENWLLRHLDPSIELRIYEHTIENKPLVIFEIQAVSSRPVRFNGTAFIRVGSYTKKLHDYPEKEREIWKISDRTSFEKGIAKSSVTEEDVLSMIDYPNAFSLLELPLPDNRKAIFQRLLAEGIIEASLNGSYNITNVGAILFAKNLDEMGVLGRKSLRIVTYQNENRIKTLREQRITKGYALGFQEAIEYINNQLPQNEEIGEVFRRSVRLYPEIAIRELVANALIHQNFMLSGCGPMVEIFASRIEISNPGVPLIDTLRFMDGPPRSRNEILAALMRRMHFCEERGSGIDKVIDAIELYQLPPPDFRVTTGSTIVVLYKYAELPLMNREDRIRACYQHACLQHVSKKAMSNTSLRKRLGIKDSNYPIASRIIKDTLNANLIKSCGSEEDRKNARYIPFWA